MSENQKQLEGRTSATTKTYLAIALLHLVHNLLTRWRQTLGCRIVASTPTTSPTATSPSATPTPSFPALARLRLAAAATAGLGFALARPCVAVVRGPLLGRRGGGGVLSDGGFVVFRLKVAVFFIVRQGLALLAG